MIWDYVTKQKIYKRTIIDYFKIIRTDKIKETSSQDSWKTGRVSNRVRHEYKSLAHQQVQYELIGIWKDYVTAEFPCI
jgi:hypothetical protein